MRALLFSLLLASGACIAEEPMNGPDLGGPDAGFAAPDAGEDEGVQLSVEGLPPETYWDSVPVFGRGPVNGTVIVTGPSDTVSAELGVDGSFCIDIPLDQGQVNELEIVAYDADGELSDPQFFQVSQFGEPPDPGEPVPARNVALGGLPTASSTVSENVGTFPAMTDGNRATGVQVENSFLSNDWLVLRIPTPDGVESIKIYGDDECEIGQYLVHTAPSVQQDMPAPGHLNEDASPWTFQGRYGSFEGNIDVNVTDCSEAGQPCQEFNFDSTVTGAIGLRFISGGCDGFLNPADRIISEIEAWSPEGVAPPVVSAPDCQNGG